MSSMTLSIDIFPIVFLKNNSSIVCVLTLFSIGNKINNLPNLNGWVAYTCASYLLKLTCVCSWTACTWAKSFNWLLFNSPGEDGREPVESNVDVDEFDDISFVLNKLIAFKQAYSVGSTWACLNLCIISCKFLISVIILNNLSDSHWSGVRPALANRGAMSIDIWYWAADNINISRQLSSSSDNLNKSIN